MSSNRSERPRAHLTPRRAVTISAIAVGALVILNCSGLVKREHWNERWGPTVPHTSFPGDCSLCHVPERWDTIKDDFSFDHGTETGVVLNGAHSLASCLRCHNDRGPVAVYTARGCGGCHVDPHQSQLGASCEDCHDEVTWTPVGMLAEHGRTRFPLVGDHAAAPCESCHQLSSVGVYSGAPVDCHLCHQREAQLAQPSHLANGWIVGCEDCHNPDSWRAPEFNHADFFVLDGAHAALGCQQCHPGGLVANTPNQCYGCHANDYLTAPDHVALGYSTQCQDCHDTTAF